MGDSHKAGVRANFIQDGRKGTHLDNVKSASPKGYLTDGYNQVHHILCHQCLQDSSIFLAVADKTFVEKCLAKTTWDVNNPKNLIGLPLKTAYTAKYAEHAKWDNLPCHQVDHNPFYREAITQWLHTKIWNTLKGEVKKCNVSGKALESDLDTASKHWHDFLVKRGGLHDGTKACWDARTGKKAKVWWIPFSMWPDEDEKTIPQRDAADWSYKGGTTSDDRRKQLDKILKAIK